MASRIQPIGFLTDGQGRAIYAVIPIAQLPEAQRPAGLKTNRGMAANLIRAARVAAGLTQEAVARAIGISQPMLSLQEQEGRQLRPATLERALTAIRELQADAARPMGVGAILAAYTPVLEVAPNRKRRDPVERNLLKRIGDPGIAREDETRVKKAGERAKTPKRRRKT
jgi:transcriptional regulator with XRE-family HTH domain